MALRSPVSRPRSPVNTEGGDAPGAQGARRAHTGSMQPTSNAAPRDAAPAECNRTSGTRHLAQANPYFRERRNDQHSLPVAAPKNDQCGRRLEEGRIRTGFA